ncbi:hypothetical protein ACIBI7_23890 [Nonomuraea fuscirosea]|uniref:hypothetical protein n=2 Tax=Nonomuraea fuscirosea TaxID=1291556 RepID=UPI003479A93D
MSEMSARRRRRVAALLAALPLAAACASPPPPVPPPGEQARAISLPFDRYNFTPADLSVIERAEDLLVGDCMRSRGLAWETLPPSAEEDLEPPNRRRYGVVEPEIARRYGYHVAPDRPSVARRSAAGETRTASLSEQQRAAYDESGGCLPRARARIGQGAPKVDSALFNQLITRTFEQSRREAEVVRVFRAWSACMRAEGWRYDDPLTAIADERWLDGGPATEEEIRAARADERCKARTGLVAVWVAAERRLQEDAVRAHREAFDALKAAKDRQLETARTIIAAAR